MDLHSSPASGAWIVALYTTGCGHCKQLRPQFIRAASDLAAQCPAAKLGAIDCNQDPMVCQQFAVAGYPTLKVFMNGSEVMDYTGERDSDSIVNFVRESQAVRCSAKRPTRRIAVKKQGRFEKLWNKLF